MGSKQANFQKWHEQAKSYYAKKEYDIAESAIEKAIGFLPENGGDFVFHENAADIYHGLGDNDKAIYHINESIIKSPNNAPLYLKKDHMLKDIERLLNSDRNKKDEAERLCNLRNTTLLSALEKAEAAGNDEWIEMACDALGGFYYFHLDKEREGVAYAKRAMKIGNKTGLEATVSNRILEEAKAKAKQRRHGRKAYAHNSKLDIEIEGLASQLLDLQKKCALQRFRSQSTSLFVVISIIPGISSLIFLSNMLFGENEYREAPNVIYTVIFLLIFALSVKAAIKNQKIHTCNSPLDKQIKEIERRIENLKNQKH
jgi:tetratricopeptide (TPR) repeat protein